MEYKLKDVIKIANKVKYSFLGFKMAIFTLILIYFFVKDFLLLSFIILFGAAFLEYKSLGYASILRAFKLDLFYFLPRLISFIIVIVMLFQVDLEKKYMLESLIFFSSLFSYLFYRLFNFLYVNQNLISKHMSYPSKNKFLSMAKDLFKIDLIWWIRSFSFPILLGYFVYSETIGIFFLSSYSGILLLSIISVFDLYQSPFFYKYVLKFKEKAINKINFIYFPLALAVIFLLSDLIFIFWSFIIEYFYRIDPNESSLMSLLSIASANLFLIHMLATKQSLIEKNTNKLLKINFLSAVIFLASLIIILNLNAYSFLYLAGILSYSISILLLSLNNNFKVNVFLVITFIKFFVLINFLLIFNIQNTIFYISLIFSIFVIIFLYVRSVKYKCY